MDKVHVKGRVTPVSVYEVFDADRPDLARLKAETKQDFETGLGLFYDRRFSEASVSFSRVLQSNPDDRAARIYLERSAQYMVKGVPDTWTGVETLNQK